MAREGQGYRCWQHDMMMMMMMMKHPLFHAGRSGNHFLSRFYLHFCAVVSEESFYFFTVVLNKIGRLIDLNVWGYIMPSS